MPRYDATIAYDMTYRGTIEIEAKNQTDALWWLNDNFGEIPTVPDGDVFNLRIVDIQSDGTVLAENLPVGEPEPVERAAARLYRNAMTQAAGEDPPTGEDYDELLAMIRRELGPIFDPPTIEKETW